MEIIKDRDLILDIDKYEVILIGTSVMNALGNGFQHKMAINFPYVNEVNKLTSYGDPRKLGSVKVIPSQDNNPIFCLLYINRGNYRPDLHPDYLDYESLSKCLSLINKHFSDKKIALPILGRSKYEGNGDKEKILDIIKNELQDCKDVTIYDFPQYDYKEMEALEWNKIQTLPLEYRLEEKKKYYWKQSFGELSAYPENDMNLKEFKAHIKEKRGR